MAVFSTALKALCFFLLIVCGLSAKAEPVLPLTLVPAFEALSPLPWATADQAWLQSHRQIRVGIALADYAPVDVTSDRTRYQGISADYLSLVAARLNVSVQVRGFTQRADAIKALQEGQIDLLTSANGWERAFTQLTFSADYFPDHAVLVGRTQDSQLPTDLNAKTLLLLDGYADAATVRQAYPQAKVVIAPNLYSALEALHQGDADAFIGNDLIVRFYLALRPFLGLQIKGPAQMPPMGFAFASKNPQLAALVERALASIDAPLRREILTRWTSGLGAEVSKTALALTPQELDWIAAHPVINVVANEYRPYLFRDANGQWSGLNREVLDELESQTGLHFVYRPASTLVESARQIKKHEADLITTFAQTPERLEYLDFTHAFGAQGWVFIVADPQSTPSSLAQMDGQTIVLPQGHALAEAIARDYPNINLRLVDSAEQARETVIRGKALATIDSEVGAWFAVGQYSPGTLRVGRSVDAEWSALRIGVRRDEPLLLSILNKGLAAYPVNEMRASRIKWLGSVAPPTPVWERIPTWVYWAALVALLVGIWSLIWNRRLNWQIGQRIKAETKLNDQLAFERVLFDGIPNPIYVRDLEGRLLSCNRSYEESFQVCFEQMQGRRLIDVDLLPPDNAASMHADYMKLLASGQPEFVDRRIHLRGQWIDAYQWTVPFYAADGERQGLLGGWIDISERKALELALERGREQAQQANQAKSTFLATMSHDIRTPMNAILGLLELERERTRLRGEAFSEGLHVAQQSASELIELIGASLDLAKIEAGNISLELKPVALSEFIHGIERLLRVKAAEKQLELNVVLDQTVDGHYWFDPLRLRQVIQNLLGNALKFTQQGSITLRVSALSGHTEPGLRFVVQDSGIGIDAERQARLFQRFVQADDAIASVYGGSGLGLSICQQLVQLMGGSIELTSEPGQGTVVTVDLPLRRASVEMPTPNIVPSSPQPAPLPRLRVLIVDDLSANRLVLDQQLLFLGQDVTAVASADEALQQWSRRPFDVLITDCNMPGMSGYELAQTIRQNEGAPRNARIVGYTANAFNDEWARCEQAGMDRLLIKPAGLAQLSELISDLAPLERRLAAPENIPQQPELAPPVAVFDIEALRRMTMANQPILLRMLGELQKNFTEERLRLGAASPARDWAAMSASLHRIKGSAGLVDAVELLAAGEQLQIIVKARASIGLERGLQVVDKALERVLNEIVRHLDRAATTA